MLEDKVIERIATINLEDAMEELHTIAPLMSPPESKQWFKIYENLLQDRRAYRMIGLEKHYAGEKDGTINRLVQARLQLLSYYSWRENK